MSAVPKGARKNIRIGIICMSHDELYKRRNQIEAEPNQSDADVKEWMEIDGELGLRKIEGKIPMGVVPGPTIGQIAKAKAGAQISTKKK